jgi:two-component system chemotaxis sensor kinase CheA
MMMDDLLNEFLSETSEGIAELDSQLVRLEQDPNDPELLGSIFRIVHTIKGTCGFLGLPRLERVAHAAESVLDEIRNGALAVTPEVITAVLDSLDRIKTLLSALAETRAEPEGDDSELIARLGQFIGTPGGGEGHGDPTLMAAAANAAPSVFDAEPAPAATPNAVEEPEAHEAHEASAMEPDAAAPQSGAASATRDANALHPDRADREIASQAIRVNVDLLEDLMTTVSELVLTRNQLMQILRQHKDSDFAAPLHRLSQVTTELQEGVMKTRMQPIGNAWAKLPRLVRDLSHELGKKLDLKMIGAETELDRQVLEMVKDPLTHMVRNCADHGIETPAERLAAGKPETGAIVLNAYHVGGHIVVEISDDGKGLDTDRIRAKALATGLASESELAAMSDQQIHQFVFKAGFSTAAKITSVSGRGVGMDVVRTNIERIGGIIELKSERGKGSRFIIKIPLTLAIVSGLIVECAGERFAIPQINVVELVRAAKGGEHRIEHLNEIPVLRLREHILPLVSLQAMLGLADDRKKADEAFIVVTQAGKQNFGIIVDRVFDTEEIVVKAVAPMLREISIYSGNTILGDGSVIMILDPNGVATAAKISEGDTERASETETHAQARKGQEAVILFRAGGQEPKAVPLALVARLEAIDKSEIEHANGNFVVQYRGKLMPLVQVDESQDLSAPGRQPILVFAEGEHSTGLMVDEIIDIVEESYSVELASEKPGTLGSAIISGKATSLVDISHYLARSGANWFSTQEGEDFGVAGAKRVLLIDDSAFFRNMLQPLLTTAGYKVTAVGSAAEALLLRDGGEAFDVIVSDLEMKNTDGFDFAAQVRQSDKWKQTPLIALSAHGSAGDRERTKRSGFARHVAKSDHRVLLKAISETLEAQRGAA